jgi:hypothetical protein
MQITQRQLATHYALERTLLREYFPRAGRRAVDEYVEALRAFDLLPTPEALDRLARAQRAIAASVPTIELES